MTDWKTKHGCKNNNKVFSVEVFTVTAEALRDMLIGVCGVLPQHIPALPAPALVLPVLGGAEGGAEVEPEDEPEDEAEGEPEGEAEGEPEAEGSDGWVQWAPSDQSGDEPAGDHAPPPPPPPAEVVRVDQPPPPPPAEEEEEARAPPPKVMKGTEDEGNPDPPPPAEGLPPGEPDPPRDPTLPIGHWVDMNSHSLDWRIRYPVDMALKRQNISPACHMYVPSPQAAVVTDPNGIQMFRVPAIHRMTGTYVILAAPAFIRDVGLIFRD